jgi:hypothetical protein
MQFIQKERLWQGADLVRPGDKVYLVGYSYWYSVRGMQHPTPVVLTGLLPVLAFKTALLTSCWMAQELVACREAQY